MKILLAVHFVKMPFDCGDIFVSTWNNFLKHHRKELQCDVIFMSGRHADEELRYLAPYADRCYRPEPFSRQATIDNHGFTAQFGVALNYNTIVDAEEYDFVLRMDHDAFTTVDSINSICSFLRKNPEVKWISPTNVPRGVWSSSPIAMNIFDSKILVNKKEVCSFAPFGYPTNNGDLWGINRKFFLKLCKNIGSAEDSRNWPYLLSQFKPYGEVCDILNFEDPRITEEVRKNYIYVDGFFGVDAWTHFCSLKPAAAGILDKKTKKSFLRKNLLSYLGSIYNSSSYYDIEDDEDISYPYTKNAFIDHIFHIASGYMIPVYFEAMQGGEPNPSGGFCAGFSPGAGYSYPASQYLIVKHLTNKFGTHDQKKRLKESMTELFNHYGTDLDMLKSLEEIVTRLYLEQAMGEYLK